MRFYWLTLGILTVWRITHFFQAEDGPWDFVIWLRRKAGVGFFGKLLDCFYCLSVWVAVPFAFLLGESWFERALLWPSLSGAAILLERVTNPVPKATSALFTEDPAEESNHVMLRPKEGTNEPRDSDSPDRSTD
jgi:Protein of unknown function (DUF1360)